MKPKRIVREPEACSRLACKKTKFRSDYRLTDPADPYVPGTTIRRVQAIPLGLRNQGYLESELDELIDALAALRAPVPAGPPITRGLVFFDSKPKPSNPDRDFDE
jgi:hypothetical protein